MLKLKLAKPVKVDHAVTPPELLANVPSRETDKFALRELDLATRDPDVMLLNNAT
jgi:hypothetical protein